MGVEFTLVRGRHLELRKEILNTKKGFFGFDVAQRKRIAGDVRGFCCSKLVEEGRQKRGTQPRQSRVSEVPAGEAEDISYEATVRFVNNLPRHTNATQWKYE